MGRIVLLTGAGGGIGSQLLQVLLEDRATEHVFATSRSLSMPTHRRVTWLELDLCRVHTIDKCMDRLLAIAPRIDWLVGATGLLHSEHLQPEKSLTQVRPEALDTVYRINASGPLAVLGACFPLLKAAREPKVAMLSAQVGSIADNQLGGWSGYRMAKAALNMGLKNAAIETSRWRNPATVLAVHPGTTLTELSKPFVARRRKPVRSALQTARLIVELLATIGPEYSGQFLTADGESLPW